LTEKSKPNEKTEVENSFSKTKEIFAPKSELHPRAASQSPLIAFHYPINPKSTPKSVKI
jgi:hypothetical protein